MPASKDLPQVKIGNGMRFAGSGTGLDKFNTLQVKLQNSPGIEVYNGAGLSHRCYRVR